MEVPRIGQDRNRGILDFFLIYWNLCFDGSVRILRGRRRDGAEPCFVRA